MRCRLAFAVLFPILVLRASASTAKGKPIKVVCDGNTVSRAPRWDDLSTGRERKTQEKVWIDAEMTVLLKRTGTSRDGKTATETYSDMKFDEDIPDETFALPKEK